MQQLTNLTIPQTARTHGAPTAHTKFQQNLSIRR